MRKKLTVVIALLLLFSKIAYGTPPSALDIGKIIYHLEPGTNVEVAYDMLGPPDKKTGRFFTTPPALRWDLTPYGTIMIFLSDSFTIHTSLYSEIYDQMEPALQRYKELEEVFHEILDAAGVAFKKFEHATACLIENSFFGLEYKKVSSFLGSKHKVSIYFVKRKE